MLTNVHFMNVVNRIVSKKTKKTKKLSEEERDTKIMLNSCFNSISSMAIDNNHQQLCRYCRINSYRTYNDICLFGRINGKMNNEKIKHKSSYQSLI